MLQVLYLKHHAYKSSWIRNLTKSAYIWSSRKLRIMQYSINFYTTINTPYKSPEILAVSCLNSGYMYGCTTEAIRLVTQVQLLLIAVTKN